MSRKSKKRASVTEQGPFSGIYSRQILRAVVEVLDLGESHVLTSRTARRFLRDSNPNGHNRREFFLALGQTLIDMGFVPDLEPHLPQEMSSAAAYGDVVERAARRWDAFMSTIQSEGTWDVDIVAAGRCFVSLAAVDLGLRLCGLNWLTGMNVRLDEMPLWAEENGIGEILRSRLSDTGLTREQFAARLGVSHTTVDNWLNGRHWPSPEYMYPLALEFVCGDPDIADPLANELRRQFVLSKLCNLLADHLGWDFVFSAVDAASSFARDLSEQVALRFASEKNWQFLAVTLLREGSRFLGAMYILRLLAAGYSDGEWKEAVLAAGVPWELAYGKVQKSGDAPKSAAAGLAQDFLDVVPESEREQALSVREILSADVGFQLDAFIPKGPVPIALQSLSSIFEDVLARRRRLAERFPESPEAHFHLGAQLGQIGKWTGLREFIDEGLVECRIASGLCPQWDAPAVERGIILTNFKAHEEALLELDQAGRKLPETTPHWRFALGYVLMELERFREGLEHLEAVIGVRSDYALAYNYAARCAFMTGDSVKGRRYAKEAHRLGESEEYHAWKRGDYRVRR